MTPVSERRTEPRFPVRLHVKYCLLFSPDGTPPEKELHNGNNLIFNISRGGFFLSTKNFLEIGTRVKVEFPLDASKPAIRGEATLVRANNYNYPILGRYEYGLQFTGLEPGSAETIEKYIHRMK